MSHQRPDSIQHTFKVDHANLVKASVVQRMFIKTDGTAVLPGSRILLSSSSIFLREIVKCHSLSQLLLTVRNTSEPSSLDDSCRIFFAKISI